MRFFPKSNHRAFHLLNATQFLGALNDNVFKLLVVYLLINVKGPAQANTILSIAGAIFVLPFLLFSSAGGVLADRLSKRSIIVMTKVLEVVIMSFSLLAVYLQSEFANYFLLFMMGFQSAVFGPSKYGIIPELVEEKYVSKANGSLTALTYLAIIFGTFLASFVTDISDKNFELVSFLCVIIAIIGLLTSLGISKTAKGKSSKKINPFFLYEIYQTLSLSWKRPYLFPAILGTAFFLFIGSYVQLNIIPYAMQSLHMGEVGGGYLFLFTAVGIAIGAWIAGRLSKERIELGLACLSGFMIVAVFIFLTIFSSSIVAVIILLTLLGVFGGIYLIPLESFIQVASPEKRRGQIIAASNFLSFGGVLLAAFCLYLFNEEFGFTAAGSFAIIGLLTLIFNVTTTGRLSDHFLPYFSQKVMRYFYPIRTATEIPSPGSLLILQSNSWKHVLMLYSICPLMKVLLVGKILRNFPWCNWLISSFRMISPYNSYRATLENLFLEAKDERIKDGYVLLFIGPQYQKEEIVKAHSKIHGILSFSPHFVQVKWEKIPFSMARPFKRATLTFSFSK